jgi:hypothetical protein
MTKKNNKKPRINKPETTRATGPNIEDSQDWERYFTPEEIAAIKEMERTLREGFPWFDAKPEARRVAYLATFPRSISGKLQNDMLARVLEFARRDLPVSGTARIEITKRASIVLTPPDPSLYDELEDPAVEIPFARMVAEFSRLVRLSEVAQPKTHDEFFKAVADRLQRLKTYQPTLEDFAVEALQNAFVGLMQSKYGWGKKGLLPTKGEVTEMAKEILARQQKEKKSGWTELLRDAGLDFLPKGRAGRPQKRQVDENLRAKQDALSIITRLVNTVHRGDWVRFRDILKSAFGGKELFAQQEIERIEEYGRLRLSRDGEDEEVE